MSRPLTVAALGALCFAPLAGCGPSEPSPPAKASLTLHVSGPDGGDVGCVGIAGFRVTVEAGGIVARRATLVEPTPVLATGGCALPSAVSVDGIDPDTPLDVSVTGLDGVGQARVSGSVHLGTLHAPSTDALALAPIGAPAPVVTIDRAAVAPTVALADVTHIELRLQQQQTVLLSKDLDAASAPLFAVEPGPFGLVAPPSLTEDLVMTLSGASAKTKQSVRLTVAADASGLFYTTTLSAKGPP